LLRQARPYWLHIAGVFLVSLLSTPLALLTPLALKIVVDSVIGSHPLPGFLDALLPSFATESDRALLVFAAIFFVAVALLSQLQQLGNNLLRTYTGERLVLGFRSLIFRHSQRLSLSYHDSKGTADSTYRIQYDAPAMQQIAVDGFIPLATAGITLVAMIIITARIDWQLALVALAISPILVGLIRVYRQRLRNQSREVRRLETSALSVVQEVLTAIRVVRAFGQESREEKRFVDESTNGMRARLRLALGEGGFGLVVNMTTSIGTATILFIGVLHVQSGVLTLGDLLLIMSYVVQLYEPLRTIGRQSVTLQRSLASAERAFALLDEDPDVIERPNSRPISRARGELAFRNVTFAYDGDRPVLHDVSFEIRAGTRLGIAGATGAGKTTLVNLLSRFYDPTSGQIVLDGVDLRDYKLADLRDQFTIVLQEPVLFSTSVSENIAYARPNAGFGDIVAAAKAADAHNFITELPNGYDTLVGERGMRLSGGERQRISLARAFLKDAPIIILDEPTNSVDMKTEASIMDSMELLTQGRTTIMIAHRLSTLENCDELLEIENGGAVVRSANGLLSATEGLESGSHSSTTPAGDGND
jgi:ATP-binding cassette subfamily B protein